MKMPCAMSIAGSDSGGGAGIEADAKTFAALGVHGLVVIAAVTAQNTKGVTGVMEMPPSFVIQQIDTLMNDFDVCYGKTGMLGSADIVGTVAAAARHYKLKLVVDPVMASATGSPLMRDGAHDALKELIARAVLVTPNVPEAERLAGIKVNNIADMKRAAMIIAKLGASVLVKGGHMKGKVVTDVLLHKGKFTELSGPRLTTDRTHGTGCSLSSAIAAELAKGAGLEESVVSARSFLMSAIEGRLRVGAGIMPVDQMAVLRHDAEAGRAAAEVWGATNLLLSDPNFPKLIPEVGINIVMALTGATKKSDVVGLSGRIVKSDDRAVVTGFPELGGSGHVANVVLAAIKHNPQIKSAMNIRFSDENLKALRKLGLSIGSFERKNEPRGVSTMEWGTDFTIRKLGKVPNAVYDRGGVGKEAMIRLIGTTPGNVAELALKVAKRGKAEI